jgi:PAS domain S-box-containing protein
MNWLVPDVTIILATILTIFLIFLKVGNSLQVKDTFFRLWALAWLLSICHYLGQLASAVWGPKAAAGELINLVCLAYSAIALVLAAECLRGQSLRRMIPYAAGAAVLFTAWGAVTAFGAPPPHLVGYELALGAVFLIAAVSHWQYQRRNYSVGAVILAYTFFFWAGCFFVIPALASTGLAVHYIQYAYQLSNLPKAIAAISMLIFLLERERANTQRQRDFSENLIENAADGIFILDLDANITKVNRRFANICGRPAEDLIGKPVSTIGPPSEAGTFNEGIAAVFENGVISYMSKAEKACGCTRDILVTCNPIADRSRVVGVMGLVKDITDRVDLEKKVLQAEKMASVGLLVSGVAHEMNNPLTSVLGFTELALADPAITDVMSRRLNVVIAEARRTRNIVQKLLQSVRQQDIERTPVRLNQVITDTITLKEYDFSADKIEIETDLSPDLPLVLADAAELQQVLINLMQNAQQALVESKGGGTITIRTAYERGFVIVDCIDDGPGVASPDRAFDLFYSTKGPGTGTGLGLSICYQTVKSLGGEIWLTNRAVGAKFSFKIPATDIKLAPAVAPQVQPAEVRSKGAVLIIDDEPTILQLSREILASRGFSVDTASNGHEAIKKLTDNRYDVVVSDFRMPGNLSGADIYKWVCENRPELDSNLIFVTGDAISQDAREFFETTRCTVIFKPFTPSELIEAVNTVASSVGAKVASGIEDRADRRSEAGRRPA